MHGRNLATDSMIESIQQWPCTRDLLKRRKYQVRSTIRNWRHLTKVVKLRKYVVWRSSNITYIYRGRDVDNDRRSLNGANKAWACSRCTSFRRLVVLSASCDCSSRKATKRSQRDCRASSSPIKVRAIASRLHIMNDRSAKKIIKIRGNLVVLYQFLV